VAGGNLVGDLANLFQYRNFIGTSFVNNLADDVELGHGLFPFIGGRGDGRLKKRQKIK
jgi:hypothetical protein